MSADEYPISISEENAQEIEAAYNGLLESLKSALTKTDAEVAAESVGQSIDFIIENLSSKNGSLLLYISKIFDKDYIFAHSLNVCLISIKIGLKLNFDKERLENLGFLALTHAGKDIKLPDKLLKDRKHDKEMAEVVRLADVYDALTHPPAYRHATTPADTLASVVSSDELFDRNLIEILLKELTLYPKGSWVQLSTKEIGKVVTVNKETLLRPMVKVFFDWSGNPIKELKEVDLSKNSAIYVLRPLTEEEIKTFAAKHD